jgi:hypothetical protein
MEEEQKVLEGDGVEAEAEANDDESVAEPPQVEDTK